MSRAEYSGLIYAGCSLAVLIVVVPVCVYLSTSWRYRRQDLFEITTDEVLKRYFAQFSPTRDVSKADLRSLFAKDFDARYGWPKYIAPLLLLLLVSIVGLWCIARTVCVWVTQQPAGAHFALSDIAAAALLGGFAWVISDHLTRARNRDFTPHDLYNSVFRCLLAIPLGLSVASFGDEKLKAAIAFLLGAFPTASLFTIMRRLGSDKLRISDDAVNGSPELEKLPSIGKAFAERLKDEGISSIAELAYSDPIALCIRTNKPFQYITDCVSQSLFWIYVGDYLNKLAPLGLRGAQEANFLLGDLTAKGDPERNDRADKTLSAAANVLGIGKDEFRTVLEQVSYDPYTLFLVQIWT